MDWNKTKTILIIAFLILNLFLFTSLYKDVFSDDYAASSDKQFIEDVKKLLNEKNIKVNCELPAEEYILPSLETEYEIICVDKELINSFLGPEIEPIENVYEYTNLQGEKLEVVSGKKLIYTIRDIKNKSNSIEMNEEKINSFISLKNLDTEGYSESYRYNSNIDGFVIYTKKHDKYSLDNSYMKFYFDQAGIYKFEMQNILAVKETAEKIRTYSAIEALPRLLSYDGIENKEIVKIEMSFYSVEDENWQLISGINSYPVWKVIFKDGTQRHLTSINAYRMD